ncbi:signal peptidase I [Rhodococcus sp. NPDC078407]|uniref:signal peptidase I n=1 Tax=Rhodococcus sp. NPDC078407 TaxID=3364509 RepID=UPI0037CA9E46
MSNTHAASTTHVRSRPRLLREIALTVGAVAGLFCVLFALAAVFFGITPLIFRSGSMAPAIDTGALALSKSTPAAEIAVGDVVKVTNASGTGITHRVVQIGAVGTDSVQLFLQGDANAEPDAESYVVSEADRVFFSVGKLGYAVTWLSGPVAVFIGGIAVGALLMTAFGFRRSAESPAQSDEEDRLQEPPSGRHSAPKHGASRLGVVLALAAISAVGISASNTPTTLAAGQDTATAVSGTITTAPPLLPPTSLACANSGLTRSVLSWPTAGTGYTYQYVMRLKGSSTILATVPVAAGQLSVTISNGGLIALGALNGTYTYTIQTVSGTRVSAEGPQRDIALNPGIINVVLPSARCSPVGTASTTAGSAARSAPQALVPPPTSTTEPVPTTTQPVPTTTQPVPTTTQSNAPVAPTTTVLPPTTTTPSTTTDTPAAAPAVAPPPEETTTTTPPAPAVLSGPATSPSGASTAQVVDIDGAPTLQIVDATGAVQYSAPATSSEAYGYGVNWSGEQLWLLRPDQLVRLDGAGGSWSRTVVDPTATDQIPADILALLN